MEEVKANALEFDSINKDFMLIFSSHTSANPFIIALYQEKKKKNSLISKIKQIIIAMMKSAEGCMKPDCKSSSSQCRPVQPVGHLQAQRRESGKSRHTPPCRQGDHSHSFSFTHSIPRTRNPAGQLSTHSLYNIYSTLLYLHSTGN